MQQGQGPQCKQKSFDLMQLHSEMVVVAITLLVCLPLSFCLRLCLCLICVPTCLQR
jgi:hypothetical protein